MTEPTVLLDGLVFTEGPRWHDGRLFFSDMLDQKVMAVSPDGDAEVIVEVANNPSGLGWTPDDELLVVSMNDRKLLRFDGSALHEVADLSDLATFHCNDMVVDGAGRAYVGNFGWDLHGGGTPINAAMVRVDPDGSTHVAADDLGFPNGTVITPDGGTLIVGETMKACLTAFDVAADGTLSNRRLWAQLSDGALPDGICLDEAGAIWCASPMTNEVVRVAQGGDVLERVATDRGSFACMLGGADRRTLYICTSHESAPGKANELRSARIEQVRVDVAGAGLP